MTAAYREAGCDLPLPARFQGAVEPGEVLLVPPHPTRGCSLRMLPRRRTAVLTGWAVEAGTARRYGADEAIALSDHADCEGLAQYAAASGAKRVFTVHGFCQPLAALLRERGIRAQPLAKISQLELFEVIERTVGEDQVDQRLDKVDLRRLLPQVPQSHIYKLLRLKRVRVNGLRAREDTLLQPGDRIVIRGDPEKLLSAPAQAPAFAQRLAVLYEDDDLMAIDKPAGLAIHPGSGIDGPTVVELARAHVGPVAAGSFEASPAHRLDRDTSGVVLVAKTRIAMMKLTEMFTAGTVHKQVHLVLAKGTLARRTRGDRCSPARAWSRRPAAEQNGG